MHSVRTLTPPAVHRRGSRGRSRSRVCRCWMRVRSRIIAHAAILPAVLLLAAWRAPLRAEGMDDPPAGQMKDKQLKQLSLEDLGKVVVTSVSKEPEQVWNTPAAIFVLTQEDIRRSGMTSIPELLRLVPGLDVARVNSNQWSISIRGFAGAFSKQLLVLIDGRSVYTPLFSGVYWNLQNLVLEDVERIEVVRGPGGTIWGANAVNGVINIITKRAKDTQGTLVAAGGGNVDQGTGTARYGGSAGKTFNYRIYGMGFVRGPESHPDGDGFDDWRIGQMGFRSDWKEGEKDDFSVQGDIYRGEIGERISLASFSPPSETFPDDQAVVSGGNLLARWQHTLGKGSDIQVQAYFDRTNFQDLQLGETRDTFDVDFVWHQRTRGKQVLTWGLGARVSPSNFIQTSPGVNFVPAKQTDSIYSGFVQYELPLAGDKLTLTGGTKLEHNNFSGFEYQPNARLLWRPTDRQSFWASVTRAVRTPSRVDQDVRFAILLSAAPPPPVYFDIEGDPNFSAERLIGYEAGYRTLVARRLYVDFAAFYNIYRDVQGFGPLAFGVATTPAPPHINIVVPFANSIQGNTAGAEIAPDFQVTRWWQVRGSYSFLHLGFRDAPGLTDVGNLLGTYEGSSPRHAVVFQSRFNMPSRLELDASYRFLSALPAQKVGAYQTADLRLGWRAAERVEFSVVGQNLFQPSHEEFGGNPWANIGMKRGVYAKLVWRR
jgi:iron complex outermembrane receptor protein